MKYEVIDPPLGSNILNQKLHKSYLIRLNKYVMKYELIYERLVKRAQQRPKLDGYKEVHHIVPRCMGGGDEENNLVELTAEEHYVAHQLLVKMHPDNSKLVYAIQAMTMPGSAGLRGGGNKMFGWLRRRYSEMRRTGELRNCKCCGKEFYTAASCSFRLYCSRECFAENRSVTLSCTGCGKEFTRAKSLATAKEAWCSRACKTQGLYFNCQVCSKEFRVPRCRLKQGAPKTCSRKCKSISQTKRSSERL
jgi:hypothetical protein